MNRPPLRFDLPDANKLDWTLNIKQFMGPSVKVVPFHLTCPYDHDFDNTGDGPFDFIVSFAYQGPGEMDGDECHQYKYEEVRVYVKE